MLNLSGQKAPYGIEEPFEAIKQVEYEYTTKLANPSPYRAPLLQTPCLLYSGVNIQNKKKLQKVAIISNIKRLSTSNRNKKWKARINMQFKERESECDDRVRVWMDECSNRMNNIWVTAVVPPSYSPPSYSRLKCLFSRLQKLPILRAIDDPHHLTVPAARSTSRPVTFSPHRTRRRR